MGLLFIVIVFAFIFVVLWWGVDTKPNNTKPNVKCITSNDIKKACWKDIMRNPEKYIAKSLRVSGEISQIIGKDDEGTHVKIGVDEPYYVVIPKERKIHGGKPLEGDYIDFMGDCAGTIITKTVLGAEIEVPLFFYKNTFHEFTALVRKNTKDKNPNDVSYD